MTSVRVSVVLGTRPEAIKCAPVILECRKSERLDVEVIATSQHRQLQDEVLAFFGIQPDVDLDLMDKRSNLTRLVARAWEGLSDHFQQQRPTIVLVQGDTTTAMIAALAAQYQQIPVAHIEAGLRTYDKTQPFPEEINRRVIGSMADLNFAPTRQAVRNLKNEGIPDEEIVLVGNPGIDALLLARKEIQVPQRPEEEKRILVTCHRRENWGTPLSQICTALQRIAEAKSSVRIQFLVHPNPEVSTVVQEQLGGIGAIEVRHAVPYPEMVASMVAADLILTDSGGIQEEAPMLGKPVLVLRETTERSEAIDAESAILVGTEPDAIVRQVDRLLSLPEEYARFAQSRSPFGDGNASQRIRMSLESIFFNEPMPEPYSP